MGLKINQQIPEAEAQETQEVKATAEVEATAPVNNSDLGSFSHKIAYVGALGDPSIPDTTTLSDGSKVTTSMIVGYRLKALEDVDVPDIASPNMKASPNSAMMTFDPATYDNKRHIAAGEEFLVTRFELGVLISQREYNGKFTGGETPVTAQYSGTKNKSAAGLATTSTATLPVVALLKTNGGSLKDDPIEDVLDYKAEKLENGQTRKTRTMKPGYEKFAGLAAVGTGKRVARATGEGAEKSGAPKVQRSNKAEMFLKVSRAIAEKGLAQ